MITKLMQKFLKEVGYLRRWKEDGELELYNYQDSFIEGARAMLLEIGMEVFFNDKMVLLNDDKYIWDSEKREYVYSIN